MSNDLTKYEVVRLAREAGYRADAKMHDHDYDLFLNFYTLCRAPLVAEVERLAGRERETCTWTEQDDKDMPGTYESSCGEMWSFIDGGVKENRVTYCHHCGGKVVPASPQEQT